MNSFQIGAITTIYHPLSHADMILSRWMMPFAEDKTFGWSHPQSSIKSLYIQQCLSPAEQKMLQKASKHSMDAMKNDIGHKLAKKHAVSIYGSIFGALTGGSGDFIVDGVLLIAEHGLYPRNIWGQKLYPRRQFFEETVSCMESSNRMVPIFSDKHLACSVEDCLLMKRRIDHLGIPFLGGSSLPHCPVHGNLPLQQKELFGVAVFPGDLESYGFHSLDWVQALIEKRSPNEPGLHRVRFLSGSELIRYMENTSRAKELFQAAVEAAGPTGNIRTWKDAMEYEENPCGFLLEYHDKTSMLHIGLRGAIRRFCLAVDSGGEKTICSPCVGNAEDGFSHFARYNRVIEDFFLSKTSPFNTGRTLLSSLALAAGFLSMAEKGDWISLAQYSTDYPVRRINPLSIPHDSPSDLLVPSPSL